MRVIKFYEVCPALKSVDISSNHHHWFMIVDFGQGILWHIKVWNETSLSHGIFFFFVQLIIGLLMTIKFPGTSTKNDCICAQDSS